MGNSGSSSSATDPRFASASRAFTHKELEDLRSLFDSLATQSQSNGNCVSPPALKAYIGIDGLLGDRVFYLVSQKRRDQKLTFEDLVIAKGTYEKGTNDEMSFEMEAFISPKQDLVRKLWRLSSLLQIPRMMKCLLKISENGVPFCHQSGNFFAVC